MFESKNKEFFTSYPQEILNTLFSCEMNRKKIDFKTENKDKRDGLIDLMKQVTQKFGFTLGTFALAIHIIDVFMDTYVLNDCDQHQNMVAVVTLILAAKIEDIDFAIPSLKQLLEFFDVDDITTIFHYADRMSLTELSAAFKKFSKFYVDLEFHIFKTMDFSLVCPTVVSFLSIYNADFVSEQDYINNEFKFESFGDMKESITLRINEVLQVVLLTHDLTNKRPSFLAASIIAATRKSLNIIPIWTNDLEMMTKYSYEHISIMVTGLIDLCIEFENTQKESVEMPPSPDSTMADSGYGSTIDLTSSAEILNYTTPKRIKLEKDSSLKKLKR